MTQPTQDPKQGTVMTQIDEPIDFSEAEYALSNCIRITLNVETYKTEVNTSLNGENWIPVTDYVKALIATQVQEARLDELEHLLKDYDIEASRATEILLNDRLAQLRSNQ